MRDPEVEPGASGDPPSPGIVRDTPCERDAEETAAGSLGDLPTCLGSLLILRGLCIMLSGRRAAVN